MKISLLNERITIQKNTVTVDSNANHKNEWIDCFSCYAYASDAAYQKSENQSAGLTVSNGGFVFTVRYCPELAHINSTRYRVIFRNEQYNITGIDFMNYSKKSIKITCEKEQRRDNVIKQNKG